MDKIKWAKLKIIWWNCLQKEECKWNVCFIFPLISLNLQPTQKHLTFWKIKSFKRFLFKIQILPFGFITFETERSNSLLPSIIFISRKNSLCSFSLSKRGRGKGLKNKMIKLIDLNEDYKRISLFTVLLFVTTTIHFRFM